MAESSPATIPVEEQGVDELHDDYSTQVSVLESAETLWLRLIKDYDQVEETDESREIKRQFKKREIIISVFGRHNCGKSTLLNAILNIRCLPMSAFNETGVQVKIKHDEAIHSGYCRNLCEDKCPKLVKDGANQETTFGDINVVKELEKANVRCRDVDVDNSVAESYTIYANVPLLADPPAGWELVLVDTPGFGDASMNNVVASAEMLLTTSSIYLYVIDSGSTGDAVDAKNLWNIFNRDANVFSDNRIVIAVNKYDHYLEDMSGMSQPWQEKQQPDLKQKVCDQIKARIGHKCPPEFVVPVSGKWAVYAQNLKHYPNNEKWKKKVIECLSMVPEQLREESDPENQAKLLESSSGISELGDRLKETVDHCKQCWVSSLVSSYVYHLSNAQRELEKFRNTKEKELEGCRDWFEKERKYVDAKANFSKRAENKTVIMRRLKEKFDETDMPVVKELLMDKLKDLMEVLEAKLIAKQKDEVKLDAQFLKNETRKYTEDEIEPTLNTALQTLTFDGVFAVFREYHTRIRSQDKIVEEAALECLGNWIPWNDSLTAERERQIREGELLKRKDLTAADLAEACQITIPDVRLTRWDSILIITRSFCGASAPFKDWRSDINSFISKVEVKLCEEVVNFIETKLRESITKSVADAFVTQMKRRGEVMADTFDLEIDTRKRKKEEENKKCKRILSQLNNDIDDISRKCKALNDLRHLAHHRGIQGTPV